MGELMAYWSSSVGAAKLSPADEADFQQEYRRRSYGVSLLVLLIAAVAAMVLAAVSPRPISGRELAIQLTLAWAAPLCLLVSRSWSERWYPWVISVLVTASLSYYLVQGLYQAVINNEAAAQNQLFQFQMRTVVVTFFVTTLLQLPFVFACVLALANYVIFATIQGAAQQPDTPYVLVRIGLLVMLGIFVSWVIEARERRLFAARLEAERRLQQYLGAQQAALNEIKLVESEFEAERERRLKFIRDMLHDVRNTIGAIGSNIDNYEGAIEKNRPDLVALATRQVRRSYKVTSDLADDLFDLSSYETRREASSLEPVDVAELVTDVTASLRHKALAKNFDIRQSVPTKRRIACLSHRKSLQRVLINLVSNAVKFTRASPHHEVAVLVRAVQNGRYIDIHVYDRGVGIAPERRDEIWEYGKTTPGTNKESGHGIGLTLVRAIAESIPEHSVRLYSAPGRGSRFTVRVPACDAVEPQPLQASVRDATIDGLDVLIIDDDTEVLQSEKLAVSLCGANPLLADSAASAQAVLAEQKITPALILADFNLRDGEKGTDVVRAVRTFCSRMIPAIIVTSDRSVAPEDAIKDLEQVALLRKPLKHKVLAEEAQRLIARVAEPATADP